MATRNDTSKSRSGRNSQAAKTKSASRQTKPTAASATLRALEDTIEDERARLMQAHSILNCVAIAMEAEDVSPGDGPHYPTLIEKACDLINESINRLDSVELGRGKSRKDEAEDEDEDEDEFEAGLSLGRGKNSVREPSPVYGYNLAVTESEVEEEVPQRTVN